MDEVKKDGDAPEQPKQSEPQPTEQPDSQKRPAQQMQTSEAKLTPEQHVQITHVSLAVAHAQAAAQQLQAGATPEVVAIHLQSSIEHAKAGLDAIESSAHAVVDAAHSTAVAVTNKQYAVAQASKPAPVVVQSVPPASHTVAWVLGAALVAVAAGVAVYAKLHGAW